MLSQTLKKLIKKQNLSDDECTDAFTHVLAANNPEQIAAFLALMHAKGETVEELLAIIKLMQTLQISLQTDQPVLDIVGTGGDGANTVNISTAASILAASCGVPIVKHGNRAASSQAGSADVLEALGCQLEQGPEQIRNSLFNNHFGFCYAPHYLPALGKIKNIRSQLKIPTLFNLIGPLLNPARPETIILGVYDPTRMQLLADLLIEMGIKRGMVVHGSGLDELNCLGPCEVITINALRTERTFIDPLSVGLPRCELEDLRGGTALVNAELLLQVFKNNPSPLADTIILNAAAALMVYGKAQNLEKGIAYVRESLAQGRALQTLASCVERRSEVNHA